jgi:hypothetical protein
VTAKSVRVRVREGVILYDEEGRALGVGQELTVSADEAKSLQEAGTVEVSERRPRRDQMRHRRRASQGRARSLRGRPRGSKGWDSSGGLARTTRFSFRCRVGAEVRVSHRSPTGADGTGMLLPRAAAPQLEARDPSAVVTGA